MVRPHNSPAGRAHRRVTISAAFVLFRSLVLGYLGANRLRSLVTLLAIGLAVAVPAVLGYNILLRRNKGVQEMVSHFTHELHAYLISGAKMGLGMDKDKAPPAIAKSAPAAAR